MKPFDEQNHDPSAWFFQGFHDSGNMVQFFSATFHDNLWWPLKNSPWNFFIDGDFWWENDLCSKSSSCCFIKFITLSLMETLELGMQFQTNLGFKDLNYRCKCFKSTWKKLGQICSKSFSPERQILGGWVGRSRVRIPALTKDFFLLWKYLLKITNIA